MKSVKVTSEQTVVYTIEIGGDTAAKLEALLRITQRFTDEGGDLHTDLEDIYLSLSSGEYTADIVDGQIVLKKEVA